MDTQRPPRSIWVVDDSQLVLRMFETVARSSNLSIRTFPTGLIMLQELAGYSPQFASEAIDAILVDAEMSGLGGFEVIRLIRRCGFRGPVFLQTATVTDDVVKRAEKFGATGTLDKGLGVPAILKAAQAANHAA